jgi:hypothetical protein
MDHVTAARAGRGWPPLSRVQSAPVARAAFNGRNAGQGRDWLPQLMNVHSAKERFRAAGQWWQHSSERGVSQAARELPGTVVAPEVRAELALDASSRRPL